jgi:hypothetical protein
LAGGVKDGKDLGYFGGLGIENPILSILVFSGKHFKFDERYWRSNRDRFDIIIPI